MEQKNGARLRGRIRLILSEALIFFSDPAAMLEGYFTAPRSPVSVTKMSDRRAAWIGFPDLRPHDLREPTKRFCFKPH